MDVQYGDLNGNALGNISNVLGYVFGFFYEIIRLLSFNNLSEGNRYMSHSVFVGSKNI